MAKEKSQKIILRKNQTQLHHLFKGSTEKFLKNHSYTPKVINIDHVDHTHFFHTINSMGMPQKYTTAVGGHFHEIKIIQKTPDEPPTIECGPALKKIVKSMPGGLSKTLYVPVTFKYIDQNDGQHKELVDKHSHKFEYKGSDVIQPNTKVNVVLPQEKTSYENDEVKMDVVD